MEHYKGPRLHGTVESLNRSSGDIILKFGNIVPYSPEFGSRGAPVPEAWVGVVRALTPHAAALPRQARRR